MGAMAGYALALPTHPKKVGECRVCGVPMMSKSRWSSTSAAGREGFKAHGGRGLCRAHHHRVLAYGNPTFSPGRVKKVPKLEECPRCERPMATRAARAADPELAARTVQKSARGYCHSCYVAWNRRQGGDFERRVGRPREEVLEDWAFIRDNEGGIEISMAAKRMGMTTRALEMALQRARDRGDSRGSLTPFGHDMRRAA